MEKSVSFLERGAARMKPSTVEAFRRRLPDIHLKMASINAPEFPHLVPQIEFLARFVEDFADGVWKESSYITFAEALFALSYLLKEVDIIPDSVPGIGFADDSAIIRAALGRSQASFEKYAAANNIDWSTVTVEP